jgi:hypothetical protein
MPHLYEIDYVVNIRIVIVGVSNFTHSCKMKLDRDIEIYKHKKYFVFSMYLEIFRKF